MYFCSTSYVNQNGEQVFNILDTADFDISALTERQLLDLYHKVPDLFVFYLKWDKKSDRVHNPAKLIGNAYSKVETLTGSKKWSGEYIYSVLDGYNTVFGELSVVFLQKGKEDSKKKLTGALQVLPKMNLKKHPEVFIESVSGKPLDINNVLYTFITVRGTIDGVRFDRTGFFSAVSDVKLREVTIDNNMANEIVKRYPEIAGRLKGI